MSYPINDPYFRVEVLAKAERPNLLSYLAMHQCYSEKVLIDEVEKLSKLSETELGNRIVDKCLKYGHFSVIEHPHITMCVSGFPHSVMAQATRHRLLSFSVQSQRYTGDRILNNVKSTRLNITDDLFYFRPEGKYQDRESNSYNYTIGDLVEDRKDTELSMIKYKKKIDNGFAPEHARDLLPQNIRQDFVVTFNARSLLHFCDLRLPKDAQPEIRTLAQMLFEKFTEWMPEVAQWYGKNRYGKNKLSP